MKVNDFYDVTRVYRDLIFRTAGDERFLLLDAIADLSKIIWHQSGMALYGKKFVDKVFIQTNFISLPPGEWEPEESLEFRFMFSRQAKRAAYRALYHFDTVIDTSVRSIFHQTNNILRTYYSLDKKILNSNNYLVTIVAPEQNEYKKLCFFGHSIANWSREECLDYLFDINRARSKKQADIAEYLHYFEQCLIKCDDFIFGRESVSTVLDEVAILLCWIMENPREHQLDSEMLRPFEEGLERTFSLYVGKRKRKVSK